MLRDSLAPSIYGEKLTKEAFSCSLSEESEGYGTMERSHVAISISCLIGDPGIGKSQFIKRIQKIIPYARSANGKGASGVGLTGSIIPDDFVGWTFAGGTLVLAHGGMAIIDEFDKVSPEDRDHLHEALEQQTVTLPKQTSRRN